MSVPCEEENKIVQLEGTFKYHSVQLSDLFGDEQKLKHATEGIIQMLLEH